MSSYYHHTSRPHPHVAIPSHSPEPSNVLPHQPPSTSWLPYAAAANAQLDAYDGYSDNSSTPVAARNNHLLDAEPYMPLPSYAQNQYRPEGGANATGGHAYGQDPYDYSYDTISNGGQRHETYSRGPNDGLTMPETSSFNPEGGTFQFPEPQIQRSVSQRVRAPPPHHRKTLSENGPMVQLSRNNSSSSYAASMDYRSQGSVEMLTDELSNMTLESDEGLRKFQLGELSPANEEWHKLVPETAREALGEREVQRQSILFEIFKSERDYVSDLEAVIDVFIEPLRTANAISEAKIDEFVQDVFWNLSEVLSFHQRMLASLFSRQREQHPLIQSVSDVILETTLQFQPAYESYIKHYPLSEARHRTELKRNSAYRSFLQNAGHDSHIRKRDLVTFISRPVTRLPRLALLLENLLKHTDEDHPDQETMPLITGILGDFVKSTQPGIEAAESKVKFWNVMENLVFRKGEIIDLDDQDASRSLVQSQTLARRQRSEIDWHGWNDYFVVLLDHYLLITREEKRTNGVKYEVSSRPIPLEFLRLGQFDQPAESRREKSEEGGLLDSLRYQTRPQYPFTIYHAAAKLTRRYTMCTNTEASRRKWQDALLNTIAIHQARRDGNRWFAPNTIDDGVFRLRNTRVTSTPIEAATGEITAAETFVSGGKNYVLVGCAGGVYASIRGETKFRRVLNFQNAMYIAALQNHNKVLIHTDNILLSYSMDLIARVSQGSSPPEALDASMEKVSGQDSVSMVKVGIIKDRAIVVYASKSFRQTTIHALEAVKTPVISRLYPGKSSSYKSFGKPFYVPRQATDITPLTKTIAIAGERTVSIVDPTNLSSSAVLVAPDFGAAPGDAKIMALKARCEDANALGIARVSKDENMVVYEEFACYVSRHGHPTRGAAIVRWETKAMRFAERWEHVLLISTDFIEVRHKTTGRLVQVIEGSDIRLLNVGLLSAEASQNGSVQPDSVPLLMSRLGRRNDQHGQSVELFELMKTAEITSPISNVPNSEEYWNGWDM
ncbi:hypothetical protein M0805_002388 [Coniferiporia weirii]|nr:hypothetical protein M0805_002388 [Coniferiporia weirii]